MEVQEDVYSERDEVLCEKMLRCAAAAAAPGGRGDSSRDEEGLLNRRGSTCNNIMYIWRRWLIRFNCCHL